LAVRVGGLLVGLGLDPPLKPGRYQVRVPAIGLQTLPERAGSGEKVVEQVQLTDMVTVHGGHRDVRIPQHTLDQLEHNAA
jgi:hypothetical protein